MEIIQTDEFLKALRRLPDEIRALYHEQEQRFRQDWRDPRLHMKKVRSLEAGLSFRVTRRYRVFFYFTKENAAVFFMIDHRKDAYR